jgi:SAM-dependent methyltransferase
MLFILCATGNVMNETYTLGYDRAAIAFVERRRLEINGAFFLPCLAPGMRVLDCGCGPGTITLDIAQRVGDGSVVGLDLSESQVRLATQGAAARGLANISFRQGTAYALPLPDASVDAVFSHALLEHLSDPARAVAEFRRVLKPGGWLGVCTPDWGGFLYSPATPELLAAVRAYTDLQNRNGGDVRIGHKLLGLLVDAGFEHARATARYENYDPLTVITDLIAWQLDSNGFAAEAHALREWGARSTGMFAEAWVECVGRKPCAGFGAGG